MREKKTQNIQMGQRFREARQKLNMSRDALAEQMGLSVQFITDLELGNTGIRLDRFAALCQLLNVNAHTVLFGEVQNLPLLSNLETMLANRDKRDVVRLVAMMESLVKTYFEHET